MLLLRQAVDITDGPAERGELLEMAAQASLLAADDQAGAVEGAREAYDRATRLGVTQMAQRLAGTYAYGATYSGLDWDGPLAILDAELECSRSASDRVRLLEIRQWTMTWRGEDTTTIDAEREEHRKAVSDPDFEAWTVMLSALADLLQGRSRDAILGYRRAIPITVQDSLEARVGLIRSAMWARDPEAAAEGLREIQMETLPGLYTDATRALAVAGVAALEGRAAEAVAAFREAVALYTQLGVHFDAALARLDALIVLPDTPGIAEWADQARERVEIVRSAPLLARLEEAVAAGVTS